MTPAAVLNGGTHFVREYDVPFTRAVVEEVRDAHAQVQREVVVTPARQNNEQEGIQFNVVDKIGSLTSIYAQGRHTV